MPWSNLTSNCFKQLNFFDGTQTREGSRNNERISKKSRKLTKRLGQKILLLGTGESGKSTFLKQMRIITGKSFTDTEMEAFKSVIYDNIYKGVLYLLQVSFVACILGIINT